MTAPHRAPERPAQDLANAPAFIEKQFPVSKLSKESYKERKAGAGQTLTSLGKWWGRKPLVLVRAAILGLLLPATDDPTRDRETFLALMTMDDDGLLRRLKGSIPAAAVHAHCTPTDRDKFFTDEGGRTKWQRGVTANEKGRLQRLAFRRMGYDEKLKYCLRPEEIDGPSPSAWTRINAHLGTNASSLPELVQELGNRRFGHTPRVGDVFSGGGGIPFEAARTGCDAYGSDLNPVAAALTWAALNIVGGGENVVARVRAAQRRVFEAVHRKIDKWGIERNEDGWIADAYLYCNEVVEPLTGWRVPLAPSWVISQKAGVIARLVPDESTRRFEIEILEGASTAVVEQAKEEGTWKGGVRCPVDPDGNWLVPSRRTAIGTATIRGRAGLRLWESGDVMPRADDVYQERLYCVRWMDPATGERAFRAPTAKDLERERLVQELLIERFAGWQLEGCIPSRPIEPGAKTGDPIGMRGWSHWHHLFNPRQLLFLGLVGNEIRSELHDAEEATGLLLSMARAADWNSRISRWDPSRDEGKQTFFEQAMAPLANYSCRPSAMMRSFLCSDLAVSRVHGNHRTELSDARRASGPSDIWITDPGYADAVRYEELSEFFLAWWEKSLPAVFPDWYTDSKRALAVTGKTESFRQAMVECYRRMVELMTDDGFQIVMFTHQDAEVWSDVAFILWAAGLQVTAAWTVGTETSGVIQNSNEVQGTVLLVLRKRKGDERGDLSDIFPEIQREVRDQLASMQDLDDKEEPNFGDADYQLAAYAAVLRVLTGYATVAEIDVERELYRTRGRGERSPLAELIEKAVKLASDYLVPDGLEAAVWRKLGPEERLYLKGVEVEAHGEYREGVYQEFARGYGVREYRSLLASGEANATRLKTPSEFKNRDLEPGTRGLGGTLLRQVLYAVYETGAEEEPAPARGRAYLRDVLTPQGYWDNRQTVLQLLDYLARRPSPAMAHWRRDAEMARLLHGFVQNDGV